MIPASTRLDPNRTSSSPASSPGRRSATPQAVPRSLDLGQLLRYTNLRSPAIDMCLSRTAPYGSDEIAASARYADPIATETLASVPNR